MASMSRRARATAPGFTEYEAMASILPCRHRDEPTSGHDSASATAEGATPDSVPPTRASTTGPTLATARP